MPRNDGNTFDAGSFGTLRYDFTAWGGSTGPIPDPSDKMISDFFEAFKSLADEAGIEDDFDSEDIKNDPEAQERMREAMDKIDIVEQQQRMVHLIADLCQKSPDYDEIMRLPFRIRQKYVRWLQDRLMNPESGASDAPARRSRVTGG